MGNKTDSYLTLTALGTDKPGIVATITKVAKQCKCSLTSSKLSVTGDTFATIFSFSGTWHTIAKLESHLQKTAHKHQWQIHLKRNQGNNQHSHYIPYYIQVIALDKPGILLTLTSFFSKEGIQIDELNCETFTAPKTSTLMANINFHIFVSTKTNISSLRESFLLYSEEHHLDVVMEPVK